MSQKTNSSRALKAVVIGVALEEGTRLVRKYGPALLDKIAEQAIDKGPGLVNKGWQKTKTEVPPAVRKVKDGAVAAGRGTAKQVQSLRHRQDGDREGAEGASAGVPEEGSREEREPVQG